jgi:arylsulfatase A-like enzyme
VFLSDHGDMVGDHHLWRKTYAYEGSARVPLIVAPPTGAARHVADEVVELRDVMPTILDIAGVASPPTDGRSLVPLTVAASKDWRAYIHGEHCQAYAPEQEMHYVTDGRQKFIWLPRIGREQFFDLQKDPGETKDLIADAASQPAIKQWRDRLTAELSARNCGWVKDDKPSCPDDKPLVSPWRDKRYPEI